MGTGALEGANTRKGLNLEKRADLVSVLCEVPGYEVAKAPQEAGHQVLFEGRLVARCFRKHDFYRFLEERGIDWRSRISKKLVPNDALLVVERDTLFILEVKYQGRTATNFRKLQTCDFKRKQYVKLVAPLGLRVEYVYVLNDWFKKPEYRDVLDYIHSVNCHYKFNELPLAWLGLPVRDL